METVLCIQRVHVSADCDSLVPWSTTVICSQSEISAWDRRSYFDSSVNYV